MKLSSYVVREDRGFAPNPYFGVLTLACCKPAIRRYSHVGDWILGTHSARIEACAVSFLAQVSDAMSFDAYFWHPNYQRKKSAHDPHGDNIYFLEDGALKQDVNFSHGAREYASDTSTDRVLICERYWYFGPKKAPRLPDEFHRLIKSGQMHKNCYDHDVIQELISWAENYPTGIVAAKIAP